MLTAKDLTIVEFEKQSSFKFGSKPPSLVNTPKLLETYVGRDGVKISSYIKL